MNAQQQGCNAVVSFGGAYSNHIYSLAAAAKDLGLDSVGIIRGYASQELSPTLQNASDWGMKLHFLGRKDYKNKDILGLLPILKEKFGEFYLIPEGGENLAGVRGAMAISNALAEQLEITDYTLCAAVGTGSTLAGLIAGATGSVRCLGISVLKGEDRISSKVNHWLHLLGPHSKSWRIEYGFHHGGYARTSPELLYFMREFEERNQLLLDPVYTAKLMWGIQILAQQGYWQPGSHVVAIHSGGLQGRRGFNLSSQP